MKQKDLRYRKYLFHISVTEILKSGNTTIPADDFAHSYTYYLPFLMSGDPYYNTNLSYWSSTPQLWRQGEEKPIDFVERYLKSCSRAGWMCHEFA